MNETDRLCCFSLHYSYYSLSSSSILVTQALNEWMRDFHRLTVAVGIWFPRWCQGVLGVSLVNFILCQSIYLSLKWCGMGLGFLYIFYNVVICISVKKLVFSDHAFEILILRRFPRSNLYNSYRSRDAF